MPALRRHDQPLDPYSSYENMTSPLPGPLAALAACNLKLPTCAAANPLECDPEHGEKDRNNGEIVELEPSESSR